MEFIVTSIEEFNKELGAQQLFSWLKKVASKRPGYCYFRYPIAGVKKMPDVLVFDQEYGVLVADSRDFQIQNIDEVNELFWKVGGGRVDSPKLNVEDYNESLIPRYRKNRFLRKKIERINSFLYLPNILEIDFRGKFPHQKGERIFFSNNLEKLNYDQLWTHKSNFTLDEGNFFISVTQNISVLRPQIDSISSEKSSKIGDAIGRLDSKIALMDQQQHKAAIQVPPGPQVIRGLAGTGKTIILAMKAAYLHHKYPQKKILYTFNTQSLYSVTTNLIKRFYNQMTDGADPDWNKLFLLHSWGGKSKEGVYYRVCMRNSIPPKTFYNRTGPNNTFKQLCEEIISLNRELEKEFDYVLVDEAQDLPQSFFELLWEITKDPHCIVIAFDELQSLNETALPNFDELFGLDKFGRKRVDFSNGAYENEIDMEYMLQKSYRNPLEVLMVAHGLGLGIYNQDLFMQMIDDKRVWESIGYVVKKGNLKKGEQTVIERPLENSISLIHEIYSGEKPVLFYKKFKKKQDEIRWIADSIADDIKTEDIPPEEIVVIAQNDSTIKQDFLYLQQELHQRGILSLAPGLSDGRDKFGEKGKVTLSTVYRAKGNEAFVVYVMGLDYLYDYLEFVRSRNRVFTSITRSKGWCRLTGVGKNMERAIVEIESIIKNTPKFSFTFPDSERIKRQLHTEQIKRTLQTKKTRDAVMQVNQLDDQALESVLGGLSKLERQKLLEKLDKLKKIAESGGEL